MYNLDLGIARLRQTDPFVALEKQDQGSNRYLKDNNPMQKNLNCRSCLFRVHFYVFEGPQEVEEFRKQIEREDAVKYERMDDILVNQAELFEDAQEWEAE